MEEKAHGGRLWKVLGKDQLAQGMLEYFCLERAKAKKFLKDAEKEKTGRDTRPMATRVFCQRILEVKSGADTDCTSSLPK